MSKKVEIIFDNEEAADHFALWLCEGGEQNYWEWMQCRELEEDGNITATHFDYHTGKDTVEKVQILTKCGGFREL